MRIVLNQCIFLNWNPVQLNKKTYFYLFQESYILNISQTLSEYESWRENVKEVLRQCKRKLDTLKENAFVEPTTTTSSVEFWWDSSLRLEHTYCMHTHIIYIYVLLQEYMWINVHIHRCIIYMYILHNYIFAYIYIYIIYVCIYIKYARFRGWDRWLSSRLKFEYIETYRH